MQGGEQGAADPAAAVARRVAGRGRECLAAEVAAQPQALAGDLRSARMHAAISGCAPTVGLAASSRLQGRQAGLAGHGAHAVAGAAGHVQPHVLAAAVDAAVRGAAVATVGRDIRLHLSGNLLRACGRSCRRGDGRGARVGHVPEAAAAAVASTQLQLAFQLQAALAVGRLWPSGAQAVAFGLVLTGQPHQLHCGGEEADARVQVGSAAGGLTARAGLRSWRGFDVLQADLWALGK